MCLTMRRHWVVCGHINTYTKRCQSKEYKWLAYLSPCQSNNDEEFTWDICFECTQVWRRHNVRIIDAIQRYMAYRQSHDYDGPLTPHAWSDNDDIVLIRDADGFIPVRISMPPTPRTLIHTQVEPRMVIPGDSVAGPRPNSAQRGNLANYENELLTYLQGNDGTTNRNNGPESDELSTTNTIWPAFPASEQELVQMAHPVMSGGLGDNEVRSAPSVSPTQNNSPEDDGLSTTNTIWPTFPAREQELVEMTRPVMPGGLGDDEVRSPPSLSHVWPAARLPSRSRDIALRRLIKPLPPIPDGDQVIDYAELL